MPVRKSVIFFRLRDWPVARPLLALQPLPEKMLASPCWIMDKEDEEFTLFKEHPEPPLDPAEERATLSAIGALSRLLLQNPAVRVLIRGTEDHGPFRYGFHSAATEAQIRRSLSRVRDIATVDEVRARCGAVAQPDAATTARLPEGTPLDLRAWIAGSGPMPAPSWKVSWPACAAISPQPEAYNAADLRLLAFAVASKTIGAVLRATAFAEDGPIDRCGVLRARLREAGASDRAVRLALLSWPIGALSSPSAHVAALATRPERLVGDLGRLRSPKRAIQDIFTTLDDGSGLGKLSSAPQIADDLLAALPPERAPAEPLIRALRRDPERFRTIAERRLENGDPHDAWKLAVALDRQGRTSSWRDLAAPRLFVTVDAGSDGEDLEEAYAWHARRDSEGAVGMLEEVARRRPDLLVDVADRSSIRLPDALREKVEQARKD